MLTSGIEFVWQGKSQLVSDALVERIRSFLFEGKGTFCRYTIVDDTRRASETLHKGATYWLVLVIS